MNNYKITIYGIGYSINWTTLDSKKEEELEGDFEELQNYIYDETNIYRYGPSINDCDVKLNIEDEYGNEQLFTFPIEELHVVEEKVEAYHLKNGIKNAYVIEYQKGNIVNIDISTEKDLSQLDEYEIKKMFKIKTEKVFIQNEDDDIVYYHLLTGVNFEGNDYGYADWDSSANINSTEVYAVQLC